MQLLNKNKRPSSGQVQMDIKEVANNILTLGDGSLRIILETSSINFQLRSEAEQEVIFETYRQLLNSLPCSIQFLSRTRELDVDKYLLEIENKSNAEEDPIYKKQIMGYGSFLEKLVTHNNILNRKFFTVIPYHDATVDREAAERQLLLYADIVSRGFERLGMQARTLTNLEIIDLFYSYYSSEKAKIQPLSAQSLLLLNSFYTGVEK